MPSDNDVIHSSVVQLKSTVQRDSTVDCVKNNTAPSSILMKQLPILVHTRAFCVGKSHMGVA